MDTHPQSVAKLPLLATIAVAYRVMYQRLRSLGLIAAVWGTLMFVVLFAVHWLVWRPLSEFGVGAGALLFAAPLVPSALIGASAAVVWHRLLLRGEAVAAARIFRLDGAVLRYAGLVLALFLVTLLVGMLLVGAFVIPLMGVLFESAPSCDGPCPEATAAAETVATDTTDTTDASFAETPLGIAIVLVGCHVLFAPVMLVAVRLMLRLPAIAIGAQTTLRDVWLATRGNSWRLYLGSAATIAPTHLGQLVANAYEDRLWASFSNAAFETDLAGRRLGFRDVHVARLPALFSGGFIARVTSAALYSRCSKRDGSWVHTIPKKS